MIGQTKNPYFDPCCTYQTLEEILLWFQGFIQAILMSGKQLKKLNFLIEFPNSIITKILL